MAKERGRISTQAHTIKQTDPCLSTPFWKINHFRQKDENVCAFDEKAANRVFYTSFQQAVENVVEN
jgi:hypothetical protein